MLILLLHVLTDPQSESRSDSVYLPRDESFGHLKSSDFLVYILKSASQNVIPQLQSALRLQFNKPEFTSFDDVRGLYDGGIKLPTDALSKISPIPLFTELFRTDGEQALKFPPPKVIQGSNITNYTIYQYLYSKAYHKLIYHFKCFYLE